MAPIRIRGSPEGKRARDLRQLVERGSDQTAGRRWAFHSFATRAIWPRLCPNMVDQRVADVAQRLATPRRALYDHDDLREAGFVIRRADVNDARPPSSACASPGHISSWRAPASPPGGRGPFRGDERAASVTRHISP